jgi:hypothetical protein
MLPNLNKLECLPLSLTKALLKNKIARDTHYSFFANSVSDEKTYFFNINHCFQICRTVLFVNDDATQ